MPWEELPPPTQSDTSDTFRRWQRKAKFLIDENIDQGLVEVLRRLGWNVRGSDEEGLRGVDDKAVFARARDQNRLLLSKDRDFLNERRFPLSAGGAVAVLPDGALDAEKFVKAVRVVVSVIAPLSRAYDCSRIDLTSEDQLSIRMFDPTKSFIQTDRYRFGPNEKTFFWRD